MQVKQLAVYFIVDITMIYIDILRIMYSYEKYYKLSRVGSRALHLIKIKTKYHTFYSDLKLLRNTRRKSCEGRK